MQPIGSYYVGVVPARDLVEVARADVRRLSEAAKERIAEGDVFAEYMGIQRPLSPLRVREIRDYVRTVDASFPNTIIVTVSSHDVAVAGNVMQMRRAPEVATIIDGQHRLAGFQNGVSADFDLIVTVFVDMEREEQAYLFATINTKQTKINPSLARDLLDFSTVETPEKIAHGIAKVFNGDPGPWFRKIKMLGHIDELSAGIITQHAFTKEIIEMYYDSARYHNVVRSTLKEHKGKRGRLATFVQASPARYPFWQFYLEGRDDVVHKILLNYFKAFEEAFPEEWGNPRYILSKTTGYRAIMLELRRLVPVGIGTGSLSFEFFREVALASRARLRERGDSLTVDEFGIGEVGAGKLRESLFGRA